MLTNGWLEEGSGNSLEARVGVGPAGWQQREGSQVVLGSITMNKASGGHGISVELFQILKADAVKVLHSVCQQIWKTPATGLEKVSFHPSPKERQCQRMLKLPYNCTYFTC